MLDTQIILWAAFEPERLSAKASRYLRSRELPLAFSHATLWDVAIKTSLARPGFSVDSRLLHAAVVSEGFIELPIAAAHIAMGVLVDGGRKRRAPPAAWSARSRQILSA